MRHYFTLTLIIFVGFALRLYGLGHQSLWYDETVSAYLAAQPIPALIAHTARDIHPPGYYLLLHGWSRLVGQSEFALAYFSLSFNILPIALLYRFARYLINRPVAYGSALLIACSPFHIWYAQEVRMYTLGAFLGMVVAYCLLRGLSNHQEEPKIRRLMPWVGYWMAATVGLYSLYYFAFLLILLNGFLVGYAGVQNWLYQKTIRIDNLILTNILIIVAYLPWMPTLWRQATDPPVPPWRSTESWSWGAIFVEIWTALSFGQSVNPTTVWPMLLLTIILFLSGLIYLFFQHNFALSFCLTYLFGPIILILLLSSITPLYHVRYIFIYSPPFFLILAAGLYRISKLQSANYRLQIVIYSSLFMMLLLTSLYAVQELHTNPAYQADDFRSAVQFIEANWQPGDAIMVNAGYVYTAYLYYSHFSQLERLRLVPYHAVNQEQPILLQTGTVDGDPQLGWGNPQADFYAMSHAETMTALTQLKETFPRLWVLRAYDTVTDPQGAIRQWLTDNAILLNDQSFAGESYIRVQSYLLTSQLPNTESKIAFDNGLNLLNWQIPHQPWQAGQTIPIKLWWQTEQPVTIDYKASLKLWSPTGALAAQGNDSWPIGLLYRPTQWQPGQPLYHPVSLTLPHNIPAGQYWLNVELYHPETYTPLPRLDGADPVVTLGPINVEP